MSEPIGMYSPGVEKVKSQLDAAIQEMRKEQRNFSEGLEQKLKREHAWGGDSRAGFDVAQRRISEAIGDMEAVLRKAYTAYTAMAHIIKTTDDNCASGFR